MKAAEILYRISNDQGEFDMIRLVELLEELTEGKQIESSTDKAEEMYNELMKIWNVATSAQAVGVARPRNTTASKLLPQCRKYTPQIKKALTKLIKEKYTKDDIRIGIENYIREIINRDPAYDYSKHRFSFYEFVKQENGFLKFFNR